MSGAVLLVAALAAAALVLMMLLVPARMVRALSLGAAFALCAFSVNDTAGRSMYLPTMAATILLLVIAVVRTRTPRSGNIGLQLTLAAWWALVLLSSLAMHGYSLTRLLVYGTAALLAAHVALRLDAASVRVFVRVVLVLMAAEVALAAVEAFTGFEPLWGYTGFARENPLVNGTMDRAQGTFGHPIVFGWFMAVCTVLTWVNPARLPRRLFPVALAFAGTGLFLSGTRSAVLAATAGILVHIVTRPGLSPWVRNVVAFVGVAVLALLLGAGSTIHSLATDLFDSGSWVQRIGNLRGLPALLGRPPMELFFGQGWGRDTDLFTHGYLTTPFHLYVVDDMYVEALGTLGLVGLVVLVLGLVVALVRGDRGSRAVGVVVLSMMFSFDTMIWLFTGIASMVLLSLPRLGSAALPDPIPGLHEGEREQDDAADQAAEVAQRGLAASSLH